MYAPPPSDFSFFSKSKSSKAPATSVGTRTNVVVTTRVVQKPKNASGAVKVVARDPTPSSASSSRASSSAPNAAQRKRKSPEVQVHPQPRASSQAKKPRLSASPSESRAPSIAPSVQISTRAPSIVSSRAVSPTPVQPKARWIDEDGRPGDGLLSCELVVRDILRSYKSYFSNPADHEDRSFEPDPIHYPVVELEYPNTYALERFILLEPKDKDHYNPILCLQSTVHTIAEHYLTPQQQVLFGKLPSKSLSHLWDDDDDVPMTGASSRSGTPAAEGSATPDPLLKVLTDAALSSLSTFLPSPSVPSSSKTPLTFNFPRRLQSAINKRNGPQFLKVMDGVNAFLRMLKYPPLPNDAFKNTLPNGLMLNAKAKSTMPSAIIDRIVDETYQRAVGPHVESLKNYAAFSSETYGELMPKFISRLIKESRLNSDSLFLDLGSGVGNVVCQASLETGCRSFGIEILPAPAKVARSQLEQYQIRCRMWGVQMGEVQLEEGDMLKSKALDELLPKADVVLVNNKVFGTTLNEAIKVKLLDLKEGAVVISLARFFPKKSTVSERNLDDISSIFQVTDREFESGDVSWTGNTDWYYIHKVDRASYADDKKKYESSRSSSTRASRSRR